MMIPLPFPKARALIRAPAHSQLIVIEASLTRKTRETARLVTEVTRLKSRLAVLVNERKLLNEAIETHDPPINKLSPEVLQEIFVLCLPVAHNAVMSARQAPLLLCRVCHGWRQLALATPRLWTSIHIPLCSDMTIVPMPSPDDVNSWLSRSKSLPLSISFWCYPSTYFSALKQYKPYFDCITSVESRWKSLHISGAQPDVLEYALSGDMVPRSLPNMDELDDADPDSEGSLSPALQSLSLPFDALMLPRLKVDYKKVTQLGITCPYHGTYDIGNIIEVLLSVPLLRSLSISGFHSPHFAESSPFSHLTIYLSELESLSITDYHSYASVWELLAALHTPLLRHWKYYLLPSHYYSVKAHLNVVHDFLRRLKEPLEELDLHIHSSGTEFRRVLGLLPGLKRLSLAKPHPCGPFWLANEEIANEGIKNIGDFHLNCLIEDSHLDWDGDSDHASYMDEDEDIEIEPLPDPISNFHCPQLEVIKCVCDGVSLSEDVLLDFLRLRTGSRAKTAEITPLKEVVFILTESPISDNLQLKVNQVLAGTGTLFRLISAPVGPSSYLPSESLLRPSYQSMYSPTF